MAKDSRASEKSPSDDSHRENSEKLARIWRTVELSRHPQRPYTLDYVGKIFSQFEILRGDRMYSDDSALIAGIGAFPQSEKSKNKAQRVFFLGQQKGRNTQERIERSFGMAKPEGYRKAMRIMDMAEQFQLPLVTFVDTPGAFPGVEAEKHGQFHAIASGTERMLALSVPTISVVIGEGGSGGALAIGCPDHLVMLKNSTYSVISPESCASILWSDPKMAKVAAAALKFSAVDLKKMGICDEIIEEPGEGAHTNADLMAKKIQSCLMTQISRLEKIPKAARLKKRYEKYRSIDDKYYS